jgi:hypothetical protein
MLRLGIVCLALITLGGQAVAGDVKGGEDPSQFGNLKQKDLSVCKSAKGQSVACGPAAAVNSFVYLEHRYASTFGERLVTLSPPVGQTLGQEMAGNDLGSLIFMGCSCPNGTTWGNFYRGKVAYLNALAPGESTSSQQPSPSAQWLADELNDGADVEILIHFGGSDFSGHYVTVTGIDYDSIGEVGTLSYIDPFDGMPHSAAVFGGADPGLTIDYTDPEDSSERMGSVLVGASEAPTSLIVPEPASWALMLVGFAGVGLAGRRLGATLGVPK